MIRRKRRVTFMPTVAAAGSGGGFTAPTIWYAPLPSITCCVAAYQAIGVPGYAESLWNLANLGTNHLTEGVAPAWDATDGWQFNASWGSYLKTGVVPDQNYSYVVRFTGHDTADVNSVFGMYSATGATEIDLWSSTITGGMVWWYGDNEDNTRPPIVSEGVFGLAGPQPYRNSLPDGAVIAAAWTEAPVEIYLGAANNNGVPQYQNTVNVQAFSIYSCTLDGTEMAAVMDAAAML